MSTLNLKRYLISLVFLSTCFQYQAVDGNKTTSFIKMMTQTVFNCSCYDGKGRIYNLAPLQRKDGPRFTVPDSTYQGFKYSYNPCRTFSLGQDLRSGDCSDGDVAVCRWVENESYQKVGNQSTFRCRPDTGHKPPQLIYSGLKKWDVVIKLECDKNLQGEDDGNFTFIGSSQGSWEFRLTHKCACPDGCPEDPPGSPNDRKKIWISVIAGAGSLVIVVIVIYLVWLKLKTPNNEENERLIENIEHNNFNDLEERSRTENLSQPMSVSSNSLSA